MPINDFLPFAAGTGANVQAQDAYASDSTRQSGFEAGTAYSQKLNKVWRQSAAMAAVLGLFATSRGPLDARDDGNISDLETSFASAIARFGNLAGFLNDTGVINNLVVAMSPPPLKYYDGLALTVVPQATNTDAAFLSVNGMGNRPILRRDGTPVQNKDLQQGCPYTLRYMGGEVAGAFRMDSPAQSEVPRIVTSPVLYVRQDGSDANNGSDTTPANAFATIGAALAYGTQQLAYYGTQLKIKIALPGTYAAPATAGSLATATNLLGSVGSIVIEGDTANQDAYVIAGSGFANNTGILHVSFGTNLTVKGVKIQNANPSAFNTITCSSNATLFLDHVTLSGSSGVTGLTAHIYAPDGGQVRIGDGCKILSSMPVALRTVGGGITIVGLVIVQGTLNFASAFATAEGNGRITLPVGIGAGFDVTAATVTGYRYSAGANGSIQVFGGGANVFPGSMAGSSNGGYYG